VPDRLNQPDQPDRFDRHQAIPGWDQQRLASATVVVIGAGALGNEVLKNLALAGVGRLVICDPDDVATSNLSRTVLFREADVGRPKAVTAARALAGLAPGLQVETRVANLATGVGLGELAAATAVAGCLDTLEARLELLGRCALVEAPLVDGGTHPWGGEVRVRWSTDEPCFGCTLTPAERSQTRQTPWTCGDDADDRPVPSSVAGTTLVAGWMTMAILRLVLGAPVRYRLLTVDGEDARTHPVEITRDAQCPFHRRLGGPVEDVAVSNRDRVARLLDVVAPDVTPLAWVPFSPGKRRDHCTWCSGDYTHQDLPTGRGGCPVCGTPPDLDQTLSLREADPDAVLGALGVAPAEIIPVRRAEGGYRWLRLNG
jgi:molybdopterin/thiamine biosynthesis adenylyltransferase